LINRLYAEYSEKKWAQTEEMDADSSIYMTFICFSVYTVKKDLKDIEQCRQMDTERQQFQE
jgi:hypothetical protein